MKNEDFEVKLLIKQNTEMATKLQNYRRDNQQLTRKNQNLNCWVQNLSEVFASIGAAWKVITDNEQAFYTLMRKKSDPNSKAMISKYISHFKTFDEIITNLGDKITNEGHSQTATIDAKARLTSFVNNYNMFFMEFVQNYFKFNDEHLAFINEKMETPNIQQFTKQIMSKELQNRQKVKDFQSYFTQFKENLKVYENYNQHKLLDGIIILKNKQIDILKDQNQKKTRKISYMSDYNSQNVTKILQDEHIFECFCGGAHLQYYNKVWEQSIKNPPVNTNNNTKIQSELMIDEEDQIIRQKIKQYHDFEAQKSLLLQRNVQCLSKFQKLKLQNRLTDQIILQSPVFLNLKSQFNDLLDYTNDLINKLNKNYQYLNQLERARLQEIQQLKQKYEKNTQLPKIQQHQPTIIVDHKFLTNFRDSFVNEMKSVSTFYQSVRDSLKQKGDSLIQTTQIMRTLKKQNEDLNRRLNDLQEKASKSVDHLEYRHSKYNELQAKIIEMFKGQSQSEDNERLKKLWDEYVDYVKTRDKKIKAMEDQIRKKDKQINHKTKLQQVHNNVLLQTESIYMVEKKKIDKFDQFIQKINQGILVLSQQNYKMKIEFQQEKNFLTFRLKNEAQVKAKLEEKMKYLDKIQAQMKLLKEKQIQVDLKLKQFNQNQKETLNKLKIQLKQKQRQIGVLNQLIQEKDKNAEKIIEDKEKKNLEINRMRMKLKSIQEKTQYEVIKTEMEEYKSKLMCRCGAEREREVILKTCPHIFCKKCIQDSVGNRNRKCPICGIRFTKTDIHQICWN